MAQSVNEQQAIRLPAERLFVDVLGINTAYYPSFGLKQRAGDRPVVVLAHGGAPGASSELNWFQNYATLVLDGYDVVAYDQPGFGYSSSPSDHSIDFRYQHLVAFLNALQVPTVHLVGNSIGGLLCSLYALRQPSGPTVSSLILSAAYPFFDPPPSIQDRLLSHRARLSSIEPTFDSIKAVCMNTFNQEHCVTDDIVRLRLAMLQGERWESNKARGKAGRGFRRDDIAGGKVSVPALHFWGVEDRSLPYEIGIEAMKHYTRAQFVFLTQCGHWPQTEQYNVFNRTVLDFLGNF